MIIRPATLADAPALARLGAETFVAAFGDLYRPEDLAAFLAEVHNPEAVAAEITGDSCTHRLVEVGGALVAFCKLRYPTKFAAHHDAILLSVYAENFGAQRFYQRYGFAHVADITFQVGEQLDPEFLYELKL